MTVATLSKAWFCGRWLLCIPGLNPAGDMDVCLSVVNAMCQMCQADVSVTG
jgi:hypothetical protein